MLISNHKEKKRTIIGTIMIHAQIRPIRSKPYQHRCQQVILIRQNSMSRDLSKFINIFLNILKK